MNSFEYTSPTDLESAIGLLSSNFGETEILGEKKVCEKDRDERLAHLSDRDRE